MNFKSIFANTIQVWRTNYVWYDTKRKRERHKTMKYVSVFLNNLIRHFLYLNFFFKYISQILRNRKKTNVYNTILSPMMMTIIIIITPYYGPYTPCHSVCIQHVQSPCVYGDQSAERIAARYYYTAHITHRLPSGDVTR